MPASVNRRASPSRSRTLSSAIATRSMGPGAGSPGLVAILFPFRTATRGAVACLDAGDRGGSWAAPRYAAAPP